MAYLNFFSIEILDGGIVFFDEATGHKLHRQGRFAHTARTENDHFEFTHVDQIILLYNLI